MPSSLRMKRINDRMKQVLSTILLGKIEDPRLSGVIVTDVNVDRELDYANIYVSAIEGHERTDEVMEALHHARGFLRYEISQEIDLRVTPRLGFFWDPTPENAAIIESLLSEWQKEEHPVLDEDEEDVFDDEYADDGEFGNYQDEDED